MAATGGKGGTINRRVEEPGGRRREDARGDVPSFVRASLAPPAGIPIDESPSEEHRRAPRRRLSGGSRLRVPAATGPDLEPGRAEVKNAAPGMWVAWPRGSPAE